MASYNTVFCFKGVTFTIPSIPFNVASGPVGSVLSAIHLKARPLGDVLKWENDILEGKIIRFEGTKVGSDEVIQMDARAIKVSPTETLQNHWTISFTEPSRSVESASTET